MIKTACIFEKSKYKNILFSFKHNILETSTKRFPRKSQCYANNSNKKRILEIDMVGIFGKTVQGKFLKIFKIEFSTRTKMQFNQLFVLSLKPSSKQERTGIH